MQNYAHVVHLGVTSASLGVCVVQNGCLSAMCCQLPLNMQNKAHVVQLGVTSAALGVCVVQNGCLSAHTRHKCHFGSLMGSNWLFECNVLSITPKYAKLCPCGAFGGH